AGSAQEFSPRRRFARRIHLTRVTTIFQKRLFSGNMARPPLRPRRRPWGGTTYGGGTIKGGHPSRATSSPTEPATPQTLSGRTTLRACGVGGIGQPPPDKIGVPPQRIHVC